jgi:hypothetical protein
VTPKLCRRGHEKTGPGKCAVCRRVAQYKYERTAKGKATGKRYRQTERGKTRARASHWRRYHHTELGEKVRQRVARWFAANSERHRAMCRRYYWEKIRAPFGSRANALWGMAMRNSE